MLERIGNEGRVGFCVLPGSKTIEVGESCDCYYQCFLTKPEFAQLIEELIVLRDTMEG